MTNFIPIFPLPLVVFPGEKLNLHIFEPRYKQLINECVNLGKPFGIPPVIHEKVSEMGTLVMVTQISHTYEDGRMDIKTEGREVFRILEIIKELPEKLYSGAIVNYPENVTGGTKKEMMRAILSGLRSIYSKLEVQKEFNKPDSEIVSYDIAHHMGLSLEDEYRLLGLLNENQRQEFLKRHLARVVPIMKEMEELRKKVKLNGHFKNLEGFNFSK